MLATRDLSDHPFRPKASLSQLVDRHRARQHRMKVRYIAPFAGHKMDDEIVLYYSKKNVTSPNSVGNGSNQTQLRALSSAAREKIQP